MRRKCDVVWAKAAADDLRGIVAYLAEQDPAAAKRVFTQIQKQCATLEATPDRGRIPPELREEGVVIYRELVVEPWRILYRRDAHAVVVLLVIDSRRNVEDVLLHRLTR